MHDTFDFENTDLEPRLHLAMASKKAIAPPKFDDLDNFFLEGDLDDDPFASPKDSNKRKGPGDLNVDEEVSVAKKARVPRIKLDQERYAHAYSQALLSPSAARADSSSQTAFTKGHTGPSQASKELETQGEKSRSETVFL